MELNFLFCYIWISFLSLGKIFTSTLNLSIQVLQRILMGTDVVKNVNKNNASHAVLFEALALVSSQPNIIVS